MGKSSRKNKEKKKDFQKVKLKVGKKKPMPDNFTNTAFKSQSVLMKEQFKVVDGAIPQTKKKQTIEVSIHFLRSKESCFDTKSCGIYIPNSEHSYITFPL